MSIISKPNTFSPNTSISSSQVNANFDTIYNDYNGGIAAANLATGAVTTAKIADGNVTTVKIGDDQVTAAKVADGAIDAAAKISDGVVTSEKLNATIACRAYLNQAQNLSTEAKILLNAENFDTGSDFDTTNSRFVVPVTGYYQVSAAIRVSNLDANGALICSIFVNGSVYARGANFSTTAADDPSSVINSLVFATAGQYIELYGLASTSEALTTGSDWCFMSIHFIGV